MPDYPYIPIRRGSAVVEAAAWSLFSERMLLRSVKSRAMSIWVQLFESSFFFPIFVDHHPGITPPNLKRSSRIKLAKHSRIGRGKGGNFPARPNRRDPLPKIRIHSQQRRPHGMPSLDRDGPHPTNLCEPFPGQGCASSALAESTVCLETKDRFSQRLK